MHAQVIETVGVKNNEVVPNLCDPDAELWFVMSIDDDGCLYFTKDGDHWLYSLFEKAPKIIGKFSNEERLIVKKAIKRYVDEICQTDHVVRT